VILKRLTPLCAVLPCPADAGWVCEAAVQIAGSHNGRLARACRLHVAVDAGDEGRPARPPVNSVLCALGLGPAVSTGDLACGLIRLDVVAEVAKTASATINTVRLPHVEDGGQSIGKGGVRVRSCALAEELLLELGGGRTVGVHDIVHVLNGRLDVLGAVAKAILDHAAVHGLKVERLVDAGLYRGRRGITGVDGVRVLVADECSTHSRVRATDEDPRCLVGRQSSVDVRPLELLGKLDDIQKRLFSSEVLELVWRSVKVNGNRRGFSVWVC
jgi:hypothetical protein